MSLELFIGPMFAGKSSAIQSIIRRHRSLDWSVFVITNAMDTRYSDTPMIVNHDQQQMPAVATTALMPLLTHADYRSAKLVVIEEAQFFSDLLPFVLQVVDSDKKNCVVVGLDGDAERRPFGKVLDLIPHCDKVTKLTAMCKLCGDGTPALFSAAVAAEATAANEAGVPCVGGAESYMPMCRKHYLASKQPAVLLPSVAAADTFVIMTEPTLLGRI